MSVFQPPRPPARLPSTYSSVQIVHNMFGSHLGKVTSKGENVNEDSYTNRGGGQGLTGGSHGLGVMSKTQHKDTTVRKMGFPGFRMTNPQD